MPVRHVLGGAVCDRGGPGRPPRRDHESIGRDPEVLAAKAGTKLRRVTAEFDRCEATTNVTNISDRRDVLGGHWPALPYEEWHDTCDTLHAHTQVLGKLAVALAPPEPQLQHAALRLTARGWETAPLPAPDRSGALVVALDLHTHDAVAEHSDGRIRRVPRAPYRGRSTPVNAWWGTFDLAVSLFSGQRVDPPSNDFIMRNSANAEQIEIGWWPGDGRYPRPAFFAFAFPAPAGFDLAKLAPPTARWDTKLGEYILDWDDVRATSDPKLTVLDFGLSAIRHACAVCG